MMIDIKRLGTANAAIAIEVVQEFAGKDVSLEYMRQFLSNPLNYLIVASVGGEWAGFLLAHALERLKEESYKMFIYELDVAPRHRRKGVGTALIGQVLEIVSREKMMNAFVFTNHSNEAAVEFYKSTGGRIENGDDLMFVYEA